MIIKSYKGFDKNMQCRGFQYEEGKEYEMDGEIKVCNRGFHACVRPLDVLSHYAPSQSVYHEVEQSGNISRDSDDTKIASSKIKIGARLDIRGLVKAQIEYVKAHTTTEHTDPKAATAGYKGAATAGYKGAATAGSSGAATAGDKGAATAGYKGAATAGYKGAATAGDYGAATAGYKGAATAGDYGAATAGSSGAATAGDYGAATAGSSGAATAGYNGAATAGSYGAATSRGSSAVGKDGIACARGNNVRVKGGLGAILVLAEEDTIDCDIKHWKAIRIDGKRYKPDTWYRLDINGKVVKD